ncbi:LPXTG cell wall anchor domain-containing protein [Enterococcus hirae]
MNKRNNVMISIILFFLGGCLAFSNIFTYRVFSDTKSETEINVTFIRGINPGDLPGFIEDDHTDQSRKKQINYENNKVSYTNKFPKTNNTHTLLLSIFGLILLLIYFYILMKRRYMLNE